MPRDDWAKARRNDVARKGGWRPGQKKAGKKASKRRSANKEVQFNLPEAGTFNRDTVLWFGQYKGQALK